MRAKVEALETAVRDYLTRAGGALGVGGAGHRVVGLRLDASSDHARSLASLPADEAGEESRAAAAAADGEAAASAMEDGEGAGAAAAQAPAPAASPAPPAPAPSLAPEALPAALRAQIRSLAPVMRFVYRDTGLHRDAHSLLAYAVEKAPAASRDDKAAVAELWRSFFTKFLQVGR